MFFLQSAQSSATDAAAAAVDVMIVNTRRQGQHKACRTGTQNRGEKSNITTKAVVTSTTRLQYE